MTTTVYTDGACIGNPGPGGWAWAIPGGAYASGAAAGTTNQRMELTAALDAVRSIDGPLEIMSDSKYVVDCFVQRWYEGWERRGWTTAGKKPVVNQDLWRPLIAEYQRRKGQIRFSWVKGHADDPMNDVVDRLATQAAATQGGRSGTTPPTSLGPADRPHPRARVPARAGLPTATLPAGWRVVVLGHRPPELGGYDPSNPVSADVRRRLGEILRALVAIHADTLVVSGLGLGAEQLGAEAAIEAGVPFAAVLAYPDPDAKWSSDARRRYADLVAGAATTVTISPRKPTSKQDAGMAIGRRNDWLLERADAALVVWDGTDPRLGAAVAQLQRLDPGDVWIVEPIPR